LTVFAREVFAWATLSEFVMRIVLPEKDAVDYRPLYVVPETHPSQEALDPSARDVVVAQTLGAEWVPGGMHMRPGPGSSEKEAAELEKRFGTIEAKARAEKALTEMLSGRASRDMVNRAADAAVRAAGEAEPSKERTASGTGSRDASPDKAGRTYFYTVHDVESPYDFRKLYRIAKEAGLSIAIDYDRASPMYRQPYTYASVPPALEPFRSEAAQKAFETQKSNERLLRETMIGAANLEAGDRARLRRPLTVPKPEKDPEGFNRAREAIRKIARNPDKLRGLIDLTRQARDEIKLKEDTLVVSGLELTPMEKNYYGMLTRGIRLGEHVLRERDRATAATGGPANERSGKEKAPPRRVGVER
jgi:hypothetical protein